MKYVNRLKNSKDTIKQPQSKSDGNETREKKNATGTRVDAALASSHRTDQLYSHVVKSRNPVPVEENGLNFLSNEINQLFDCGISELLEKIKAFVPSYKSQTDQMAKKLMIIDFLVQFS